MAHFLVTGAAGWLGRHVVAGLSGAGHRVTAAVRTPPAVELAGADGVAVGDLAVRTAGLPVTYDWVVHAAAEAPPRPQSPHACLEANLVATRNVIAHAVAAGAKGMIFTSTVSVYGEVAGGEVNEDTPILNPGIYGLSKLLAEGLFAERAGVLPTLVLRLPGVIGPGARTPWLGRMVERILRGEEITLYNPDSRFNNAVHTDDLVGLIAGLPEREMTGFDVVTLGAGGGLPLMQVMERLFDGCGQRVPVTALPASRPSFYLSSSRAVKRYGYVPQEIGVMAERFAREQTLEGRSL